jgi:hypothetical protein
LISLREPLDLPEQITTDRQTDHSGHGTSRHYRKLSNGRDFMSTRPSTDAAAGRNRIMIYGPKGDGTYIIEFKTAAGEALAISIPASETAVIKHFQERMPYGLFVPDVDAG